MQTFAVAEVKVLDRLAQCNNNVVERRLLVNVVGYNCLSGITQSF